MFLKTKRPLHSLLLSCALLATIAIGDGCASKLESGGAYSPVDPVTGVATAAPDLPFFAVDSSYRIAYNTFTAISDFEFDNRASLWALNPDIKHQLDKVRVQATQYNLDFHKARSAYKRNPVPANLTALQTVLGKMQQLADAATVLVPLK